LLRLLLGPRLPCPLAAQALVKYSTRGDGTMSDRKTADIAGIACVIWIAVSMFGYFHADPSDFLCSGGAGRLHRIWEGYENYRLEIDLGSNEIGHLAHDVDSVEHFLATHVLPQESHLPRVAEEHGWAIAILVGIVVAYPSGYALRYWKDAPNCPPPID
jgi:hypothetical protein